VYIDTEVVVQGTWAWQALSLDLFTLISYFTFVTNDKSKLSSCE